MEGCAFFYRWRLEYLGYRGFTYDRLNQLCYFSSLQCGAAGDVCVTDDTGQYDHYDLAVGRRGLSFLKHFICVAMMMQGCIS